MKTRTRIIVLSLMAVLVLSGFFLYRKKGEWDVAHDFYEKYYFSRIESYSDEMLEEHFRHIPDQTIQIDVEMLKSLDEEYEKRLSHLKEGTLLIEVNEPFRDKKIDYNYTKK